MTLGYRFPPGPPSEVDSGQIAMEGKMMRKTMEKMREYDMGKKWENNGKQKQWESNGNLSRTLGKLIKTRGETVERIGRG